MLYHVCLHVCVRCVDVDHHLLPARTTLRHKPLPFGARCCFLLRFTLSSFRRCCASGVSCGDDDDGDDAVPTNHHRPEWNCLSGCKPFAYHLAKEDTAAGRPSSHFSFTCTTLHAFLGIATITKQKQKHINIHNSPPMESSFPGSSCFPTQNLGWKIKIKKKLPEQLPSSSRSNRKCTECSTVRSRFTKPSIRFDFRFFVVSWRCLY